MSDFERAHRYFQYDPAVKGLRWKVKRGPIQSGTVAGSDNGYGYIRINFNGKLRLRSHIIWLMNTGKWPEKQIDHIDRDSMNDAFSNLREVSQSINLQNQIKARKNCKQGLRGASLDRNGKFRATITVNRKQIWLGYYLTAAEAHEAYLKAKAVYHKEGFI